MSTPFSKYFFPVLSLGPDQPQRNGLEASRITQFRPVFYAFAFILYIFRGAFPCFNFPFAKQYEKLNTRK
jgi:hypothetical protein